MACLVGTRERHEVASSASTAARNVDLGTFHLISGLGVCLEIRQHTYIKLSAALRGCRVESNQLNTHEVVSWCNASRHVEI